MNSSKDKVRLGIIGMGNMGNYHADYLLKGKIDRCQLVVVCDANIDSLEHYKPLTISNNGTQLLKSDEVDAVIISPPHFQHTSPQSPFSGPFRCCDVADLYQAFSQPPGPGRLWIKSGRHFVATN